MSLINDSEAPMTHDEKCRYAERLELEGEIKRLKAERDSLLCTVKYIAGLDPANAYEAIGVAEAELREG